MAESNRNRDSRKNTDQVSRNGNLEENRGNKKLPDNNDNNNESISTKGDTSNGKYSKTGMRKDEKESRPDSDFNK